MIPRAIAHRASSAKDMARKMRHVIMLHTQAWGEERRDKGWELGQMVENVLREQQGADDVTISSAILLITAKRPYSWCGMQELPGGRGDVVMVSSN